MSKKLDGTKKKKLNFDIEELENQKPFETEITVSISECSK